MIARTVRIVAHADALDRWETAHASAAPALGPFVEGYSDYWERTGSFAVRRELPSLKPVLIVNIGAPIAIVGGDGVRLTIGAGEGFVGGVHTRHALSESAGGQAGVHVWLTMRGFQRLMGGAAGALADRVVTLSELFGPSARDLGARMADARDREQRYNLLDAALAERLGRGDDAPSEIAWAFERLRAGSRVACLAEDIGWSRKTLGHKFHARFGVSPKTVARLARFERVIATCGVPTRPDWAGIAHDAGYADQSHLIREFAGFAGLTPTVYRARLLPDGGGLIEG